MNVWILTAFNEEDGIDYETTLRVYSSKEKALAVKTKYENDNEVKFDSYQIEEWEVE